VSAKKVAVETPGCENLQLISFHSTSKGLIGEVSRTWLAVSSITIFSSPDSQNRIYFIRSVEGEAAVWNYTTLIRTFTHSFTSLLVPDYALV